ncbi:MAG TPA: hypothetical protein GX747_02630, partial [Tenericutes bacterium]|nr:hypothetical protein [Mycoplasmatota bacterium]
IGTFSVFGVIILVIGGFYGVLNKIDAYSMTVDKVVTRFKNKPNIFLILTIVIFLLLSSLFGVFLPLIVLVPFFAAVLLLLGYSKIKTMAATFGSIIVGSIASVYGFFGAGYNSYFFSIKMNEDIFTKILFLLIIGAIYIYFVSFNKKEKKEKKEKLLKASEVPFYTKVKETKRSNYPLIILLVFMLIFVFGGMYNWKELWNISLFDDIHNSLMGLKIKDYPIIANIIGNIKSYGNWYNYEFGVWLIITTILAAWLYNLKVEEYINGFVDGVKKMLPVAFVALMANLIFYSMLSYSSTNISLTITDFILESNKNFNVFNNVLASLFGSLFYNDYSYLLGNIQSILLVNDSIYYPIIGIIFTAVHYTVMLIVPTSFVLVSGLKYFDIDYKDWIKYIWKFILAVLVVIIAIGLMISILI